MLNRLHLIGYKYGCTTKALQGFGERGKLETMMVALGVVYRNEEVETTYSFTEFID